MPSKNARITLESLANRLESFLGITADEDYGGLAMGYQAHCVVLEELSRASGSFQSCLILLSSEY